MFNELKRFAAACLVVAISVSLVGCACSGGAEKTCAKGEGRCGQSQCSKGACSKTACAQKCDKGSCAGKKGECGKRQCSKGACRKEACAEKKCDKRQCGRKRDGKGGGGCGGCAEHDGTLPLKPVVVPDTSAFYQADGAFVAAPAKESFYAMMRSFGYPIPAVLKTDNFWVADFVQRDFRKLGMGGVFWINFKATYGDEGQKLYTGEFKGQKYGYLGHDIYLLPGQTLPEHRHIGGNEGYGPKMESWHVRHGSVVFYGEHKGAGDEVPISELPAEQRPFGYGEPWFKSKYASVRDAGGIYSLLDPQTWHGQVAGPNGAIISEYATYHNQVEFSKPGMVFGCSEAKK